MSEAVVTHDEFNAFHKMHYQQESGQRYGQHFCNHFAGRPAVDALRSGPTLWENDSPVDVQRILYEHGILA